MLHNENIPTRDSKAHNNMIRKGFSSRFSSLFKPNRSKAKEISRQISPQSSNNMQLGQAAYVGLSRQNSSVQKINASNIGKQ